MRKNIKRIYHEINKIFNNFVVDIKKEVIFGYEVFISERAIHNQWIAERKLIKDVLVLSQLKAFLNIFLILSVGIISENNLEVNNSYFGIYVLILIISSYFSDGMFEDRNDILKTYLIDSIGLFLVTIGFIVI